MGVSGCGKSSVGHGLSQALAIPYLDGDIYHPQGNIDKMARGQPLDDEDRAGWLSRLVDVIRDYRHHRKSLLLGCSALKRPYREQLRQGDPDLAFLYLEGHYQTILTRMQQRRHFFSADMLTSQFRALEPPDADEAMRIDINGDFQDVIAQGIQLLKPHLSQ